MKGKSVQEENDVDQNVRPGQQPGKAAPPKVNKPGRKSGAEENKDVAEGTPPDEFKSPEKARKEASKISEAEGLSPKRKK